KRKRRKEKGLASRDAAKLKSEMETPHQSLVEQSPNRNRICEEAQGRSSGAGVVVPALPGVAEPADSFAQAHGQLGDGLQPLESGLAEYPAAFFLFAFGQQQLGIAENAGQWIKKKGSGILGEAALQ